MLDILVQSRRNAAAAKRFFRQLRTGLRYVPQVIVTDASPRLGRPNGSCLRNRFAVGDQIIAAASA